VLRISFASLRRCSLAVAVAIVVSPSAFAAPGAPVGGQVHTDALKSAETHSRYIIKFRKGSPEHADPQSALNSMGRGLGLGLNAIRRMGIDADLIEVDRGLPPQAAEAMMRALARNPNVEFIEPDAQMHALLTPNDTRYNEQWHYFEAVGGINAPLAWDRTSGTGIRVAVLDTGIAAHSDLNANVVGGYDFISDATAARDGGGRDSNPRDEGDWYAAGECGQPSGANSSWHGTHVAGTIAAVTNNASGVAGVSYGAKIVPIRVLGKCGGSLSDISDAIVWASGGTVAGVPANANPAEVINMSLGGSGTCGSAYQAAIDGAVARGSVVVVAAGNSNVNVSNARPANCNNVVAVAATTRTGARASFSNYGTLIDVSAPGQGILSTWNAGTTTPGAESYTSMNGTSMAAPHVAGVVALMQAVKVSTPAQVESILKSTARALPGACSGGCGAGIIDARAALDALAPVTPPPPPPTSTLSNGVAVTGLAGSANTELRYTMSVPAGASNLKFVMAGGTGDADLYVRFGSAPTTTTYECRPYLSGNNETCTIATAQAGTYHVMVRGYSTFSGVSLTGSFTTSVPSFFENLADYQIRDNSTVESPIAVSGRSGNAPTGLRVNVRIIHTYIGDLKVDLIAPNGSVYVLHNRTGGSAKNIITTYTVNASGSVANGTWRLRVNDNANGDTGYIDSWSLQF
jgi:serine protease